MLYSLSKRFKQAHARRCKKGIFEAGAGTENGLGTSVQADGELTGDCEWTLWGDPRLCDGCLWGE